MALYRTATSYLLIGTLLFCPYLCLPKAAAANESDCQTCNSLIEDHCCPSPASGSSGDRPGDSGSKTQGGNCLCHGAVLQSPTTLPSLDIALAVFLPIGNLPAVVKSSICGSDLFAIEHTVCHFPDADSGREVRALIESFLL
jgi:hypothetical protein